MKHIKNPQQNMAPFSVPGKGGRLFWERVGIKQTTAQTCVRKTAPNVTLAFRCVCQFYGEFKIGKLCPLAPKPCRASYATVTAPSCASNPCWHHTDGANDCTKRGWCLLRGPLQCFASLSQLVDIVQPAHSTHGQRLQT